MLKIEPLGQHHGRDSFDCGQPDLEDYLRRIARQHADKGVARTFVLMDDADPRAVLGFIPLADDPLSLFLPLATLNRALVRP